jgi:hypothetical protein
MSEFTTRGFSIGFSEWVPLWGKFCTQIFLACAALFLIGISFRKFFLANWRDFVPACALIAAKFLVFATYGGWVVEGQLSSSMILLTTGTLAQASVWVYQIIMGDELVPASYIRACLGFSAWLDVWGLVGSIVQLANSGKTTLHFK